MAIASVGVIFLLSQLVLLISAYEQSTQHCPPSFQCGTLGVFGYPFTTSFNPKCGLCVLNCTEPTQTIGLTSTGPWYDVMNSFSNNKSFLVGDPLLLHLVNSDKCDVFKKSFYLPRSRSVKFTILFNETLLKCANNSDLLRQKSSATLRRLTNCAGYNVYHNNNTEDTVNTTEDTVTKCSFVQYPSLLIVELSDKCSQCVTEAGRCQDMGNEGFRCIKRKERRRLRLIFGLGFSAGSIVIIVLVLVFCHLKKINFRSSASSSRNISLGPTRTKTEPDGSKVYFSVPVFPYSELEEATNNFDPSRELGDGGFGTVYYGKLTDRREVAVKRLYQRNYRQIEQFMNEVEILACLRHPNLVSLYGCTSRRSKELLLVYEYVPNGTIADHLHGDQAKCGMLSWPTRMSIAIETACALAYLHDSDIIHRDVKSNNILLDINFSVKVADFGLSRLFPVDVTHISTAPQGTPGYLDPEYHQCYQLTDKSDVYSFGVVLVELISALPAIDFSRQADEINLSSYAMKRIQCSGLDELVDHRLVFKSNHTTKRMITQVAELAFQCLQQRKEFRPSMVEVLEALKTIESADYDIHTAGEKDQKNIISKVRTDSNTAGEKDQKNIISKVQTDSNYTQLLSNTENPPSPNSVIHNWGSTKSITSTASR